MSALVQEQNQMTLTLVAIANSSRSLEASWMSHEVLGLQSMTKLYLTNGRVVETCADHEWSKIDGTQQKKEVLEQFQRAVPLNTSQV